MEIPCTKSAQKFTKNVSQSTSTARGVVRSNSPQNATKTNCLVKHIPKENTRPQEMKLHTQERAFRRALFNYSVATRLYLMEQHKKQVEKVQKMIEEEEIRMLRKELIPRAQLMPLFDRPFLPQRSSRALTVPREPSFLNTNSKCRICNFVSCSHIHSFQHNQAH